MHSQSQFETFAEDNVIENEVVWSNDKGECRVVDEFGNTRRRWVIEKAVLHQSRSV